MSVGKVGEARKCVEVTLELREDQWGMVSQIVGKKVSMRLGGNIEDAIGIGTEGNMLKF